MNYVLDGAQYVSIASGDTSVVLVLLDKATANRWHAPLIPGIGPFGNYFSVGTNQRFVKVDI